MDDEYRRNLLLKEIFINNLMASLAVTVRYYQFQDSCIGCITNALLRI